MRNPELAPAVLRGRGVAGSLAPDVRSRVGSKIDGCAPSPSAARTSRAWRRTSRKQGRTSRKRAEQLNVTADEYARDFASGKVDPQAQRVYRSRHRVRRRRRDARQPPWAEARQGDPVPSVDWSHREAPAVHTTRLASSPVSWCSKRSERTATSTASSTASGPTGTPSTCRCSSTSSGSGTLARRRRSNKAFSTLGVNPFSTLNQYASPVSTSGHASEHRHWRPRSAASNRLEHDLQPPVGLEERLVTRSVRRSFRSLVSALCDRRAAWHRTRSRSPTNSRRSTRADARATVRPFLCHTIPPTARPERGILGALPRYGLRRIRRASAGPDPQHRPGEAHRRRS